eukprot:6192534-Pleurochrysis_carterae.AAC.1
MQGSSITLSTLIPSCPASRHAGQQQHPRHRCHLSTILGHLATIPTSVAGRLATWLPAQHSNYSPLVKFEYVLTSLGSVAAYNLEHALHCRSRLLVAYSFDNSSPRNPAFASQGSATLPNQQATARQIRSQSQATSVPAAAPGTAPASTATPDSASGLPPHISDEAKQHIVAPELIGATDQQK